MKKGAPALRLDLRVASLAPGGAGVAHAEIAGERRAVFVGRAAPGDLLRVGVDPSRRPARGELLAVLSGGPDRVAPPCPWSAACGGCDWMHLSPEAQRRAHVEHLRAALPAAWRDAPIAAHAAPGALAQRARARVHVRCGRDGRAAVGMYGERTHDPVEVDACVVLDPAVEAARRRLAPLFEGCRGRGDAQIALGAGRAPVLDVRWEGDVAREAFARLEVAVAEGALAGARLTVGGAARPAVVGDPTPWTTGADGAPLRLAPGGFGQANEGVNAMLARHVAEVSRPWRAGKAVELYAGAGNFSVLLAREAGDLACVESSREACDAARANLAARGLSSARVVEADAAAYAWPPSTRLVVLDPPRSGARAVAERLAASRVPYAVYVSCDPQTLRRDLAILEPAYRLVSVAAFEMFPGTSHVEAVVALERAPR